MQKKVITARLLQHLLNLSRYSALSEFCYTEKINIFNKKLVREVFVNQIAKERLLTSSSLSGRATSRFL